jgi:hypothetical protein
MQAIQHLLNQHGYAAAPIGVFGMQTNTAAGTTITGTSDVAKKSTQQPLCVLAINPCHRANK